MIYFIIAGKYRIEYLTAVTFPGALKIIKESFCQDESICKATEVNANPAAVEELLELCADAALDGVSLVAVAIDTGDVAAVLFNKLQTAPASDPTEKSDYDEFAKQCCRQPSSRALMQFGANIDARCNCFEKYSADCSLELIFLSTLAAHRKNNLATLLTAYSLELGKKLKDGPVATFTHKDLGPKYASMQHREPIIKVPKICQGIMTSLATQKIASKLGFTVYVRLPLADFSYNGKTFSERIGYDPYVELVAREI